MGQSGINSIGARDRRCTSLSAPRWVINDSAGNWNLVRTLPSRQCSQATKAPQS